MFNLKSIPNTVIYIHKVLQQRKIIMDYYYNELYKRIQEMHEYASTYIYIFIYIYVHF